MTLPPTLPAPKLIALSPLRLPRMPRPPSSRLRLPPPGLKPDPLGLVPPPSESFVVRLDDESIEDTHQSPDRHRSTSRIVVGVTSRMLYGLAVSERRTRSRCGRL